MKLVSGRLVLLIVALSTVEAWCMAPRPSEEVSLWEAISVPTRLDSRAQIREPWIRQEQLIEFPPSILALLRDPAKPLPKSIVVRLPDKPEMEVTITSRKFGPGGATIVEGQLGGPRTGTVLLSIIGEAVAGTLRAGGDQWSIEPKADHWHRLIEIDAEKFPPD